jgi:hypothetical protein
MSSACLFGAPKDGFPDKLKRLDTSKLMLAAQKCLGAQTNVPHSTGFAVNVVFHVSVLFLALTLLYMFLIAPTEVDALQGSVNSLISSNLPGVLQQADTESNGAVRATLRTMQPELQAVSGMYTGNSEVVKNQNQWVFIGAFLILGILVAILVSMLATMRLGCRGNTTKLMLSAWPPGILLENILIFSVIGAAEFFFFKLVASKYVPVLPSEILTNIISYTKQEVQNQ